MTVTYQTSFDTVAGTISFENEALFLNLHARTLGTTINETVQTIGS